MPSLGQLDCRIEWANTSTAFPEYSTAYGDGVVESYIAIPSSPQTFSIHLTSKGYISEGLAVLVFMDGEYQCNRHRLNLKPPKKGLPRCATEIDFHLRQKEKPIGDGSFIGREWRFDTHNIVPVAPQDADSGHFDSLGIIEVLALRCKTLSNDDACSTSSSGIDTDPFDKRPDADDTASEFGPPPAYAAPVAAEDDNDFGFGFLSGLFDGANDRLHRPSFGGDGSSDGYWRPAHNYPIQGMYNGYQQRVPQPGYHMRGTSNDFRSQAPPQQPSGPGKRVHFGMGSPPRTRSGPQPQQQHWPNVAIPPPPGPQSGPDMSNHGAGQSGGYPMFTRQVPFDAIPPSVVPLTMPIYVHQPGWEGQRCMPFAVPPGYGYGFGTPFGYGLHPQGQGYGQGQANPVQGPPASNGKSTSDNGSSGHLAGQNQNIQGNRWANNTNGNNTPGNAGSDGAGNIGINEANANGSYNLKNFRSNENTGDPRNNKTDVGGVNGNSNRNQTGWGPMHNFIAPMQNNGGSSGIHNVISPPQNSGGWGGIQNVTPPLQNGGIWGTRGLGNNKQDTQNGSQFLPNNHNANQGNDIWRNNKDYKAKLHDIIWPKQPTAYHEEIPNQPRTDQSSSNQPRALYGPHGPYYTLKATSTTGSVRPEVEEEPRYDVPVWFSDAKGSTHQVQPGPGYLYIHKRDTPFYIDSVDSPYARFVFKYRTREQISYELNIHVDVEPSSNAAVNELANKSKQEIIDMLLHAKSALGGNIPMPPDKMTEELNNGLQPTVVPAPVSRTGEYKIHARPAPDIRMREVTGLGISDGYEPPAVPPPLPQQQQQQQQEQEQQYHLPSWMSNHNQASTNMLANQDYELGTQDQRQSSGPYGYHPEGCMGAYGDPGARPASPQPHFGGSL